MDATPTPTPKGDLTSLDAAHGGSAGAPTCTSCSKQITDIYHEANGTVICSSCRARLQMERNAGSSAGRFARALGFGLVGAAIGSAIWFAVLAATGYQIGLIAIAVGFLVGKGVHMGSRGRGGWKYQTLAIVLTYGAIVVTYIPFIVKEMAASGFDPASIADSLAVSSAIAAADSTANSTVLASNSLAGATAVDSVASAEAFGAAGVVIAFIMVFIMAAAFPVLAGAENLIGLLIIGFALYQAWTMNRRAEIALTGPYRVGVPRGGEEAAPA